MRFFNRLFLLALIAGSFGSAPLAFAQAPSIEIEILRCDAPAENEDAHARIVDRAIQSFTYGGFPAIERHLPALRRAANRAPACYPEIERRGGDTIVRNNDPRDAALINEALSAASFNTARIVVQRNVYSDLFLLLGAYAVETGQYDEALVWLDRGLALQPRNEVLTAEKLAALNGARRPADAHALALTALDDPARALTLDRARFLRIAGIALIDLERFDDAEAALNESIRLQSDNPIARAELDYIARLRAGEPRRDVTITAPNAPRPQTQ